VRIFSYLHMFPPVHNAGSETTVLAALRAMVRRGHEAVVLADQTPQSYEIDGHPSAVGGRHHLHPTESGVCLSGGDPR